MTVSDPLTDEERELLARITDPRRRARLAAMGLIDPHKPFGLVPSSAATRYPWRVRCSGCGWVDHFDTQPNAQAWADRHNASDISWPHDAKVGPRD